MSLVLQRDEGQAIVVNETTIIRVETAQYGRAKLVIDGPGDVPIRREELPPDAAVLRPKGRR